MNRMTELESTPSRLAQAGVDATPFQIDSLWIREIENVAAVKLRALPGFEQHTPGDLNLPQETGECLGSNPAILCLRPGEWLLVSKSKDAGELLQSIKEPATAGLFAWDQSDGLVVFRVEGDAAHWLLRKNAGLDFHVTPSTIDHCAQCKMGHIGVVIYYHAGPNGSGVFDLLVERSLARYLWTLMVATAPHASELNKEL